MSNYSVKLLVRSVYSLEIEGRLTLALIWVIITLMTEALKSI